MSTRALHPARDDAARDTALAALYHEHATGEPRAAVDARILAIAARHARARRVQPLLAMAAMAAGLAIVLLFANGWRADVRRTALVRANYAQRTEAWLRTSPAAHGDAVSAFLLDAPRLERSALPPPAAHSLQRP